MSNMSAECPLARSQAITLVPQGTRYLECDKASGQVRPVRLLRMGLTCMGHTLAM